MRPQLRKGRPSRLPDICTDIPPQVAVHRSILHSVIFHRHTRQLHNTALYSIHQRKVRHRPWEQRALGIPRTAQEERSRRKVVHMLDRHLRLYRPQPIQPNPRGILIRLRLGALFSGQLAFFGFPRLTLIAVMTLIVQHHHTATSVHLQRHHALHHLPRSLQSTQHRVVAPA